jgi:SAM-dependent methyltransferase
MHRAARAAYDKSVAQFSHHYDQIGPRDGDIELAFALAGNPAQASVLEIGCGNGRDAKAIMQRTGDYTGIDTSEKMIAIARNRLPEGNFTQISANDFDYPGPYDVVFAFAPFRHMNLEEVTDVLHAVSRSLRQGGVLYVSSNYGPKYEQVEQPSPVGGTRQIFTYNSDILHKHAPTNLKRVYQLRDRVDGQEWFEVVFQKKILS